MNHNLITEIGRLKNLMNINEAPMKLGDEVYTSIRVDNDIKTDVVDSSLLEDIDAAARAAGVVVTITTAKSDHPSHETGKASRHATNSAVDIAIINGIDSGGANSPTSGNPKFREYGNKFTDQLEKLGYSRNKEAGNNKAFIWQTNSGGNHFNHVHVSNKGISISNDGKVTNDAQDTSSEDTYQKVYKQIANAMKNIVTSKLGN